MKKRIVLCADDYGQSPAISQGIIHLIQDRRLTATSCLVNTVYWPLHASWLLPLRDKIDIGLHFNLTQGQALSLAYIQQHGSEFMALPQLLKLAFMRKLSQSAIEAECHAQLDQFEKALGFLPDYLDGHQHVQQFPIIRQALLSVYQKRLQGRRIYIRLANEAFTPLNKDTLKKWIIYGTGSLPLKRLLIQHKIPFNQSFAGVYTFSQARHYARIFKRFLNKIKDGGLIMCHPGLACYDDSDPISQARFEEYQYFASKQFLEDCEAKAVSLVRADVSAGC